MAGLVPAIHESDIGVMLLGFVYFMTNRPNGILYVGVTNNVGRRAWEHREGLVPGFTKRYGLKRLVYVEEFEDIREAIKREKRIKTWLRAWKTRLIVSTNPEWRDLTEIHIDGLKEDVDGPPESTLGQGEAATRGRTMTDRGVG